jgi:hypothetical protein
MIARAQFRHDAIGMVAAHADVVGALYHQQRRADCGGVVER